MQENTAKISINKEVISLTIPNIVTNITVPLLGMADLAIVGHLNGGIYLGAIAIGTTIFNLLYWGFGFLRMGTTGLAAQAYGAKNEILCADTLLRSAVVAIFIGILFWLLQSPIFYIVERFMNISPTMQPEVEKYYFIRIWAAPATLLLYSINGWLLGMQNAKLPMYIAITINVVNIISSYTLAFYTPLGLQGVALGSVIAQYAGLTIGAMYIYSKFLPTIKATNLKNTFVVAELKKFFSINSSIFIRSLGLIFVFTFFTSASSFMGDNILNTNTLLLQLFTLFSYIMDGFAYAGESLTGKYFGAKNLKSLKAVIRTIILWGVILSSCFTVIYANFLKAILSIFTDNIEIIDLAMQYKYWIVAVPFCGFLAFAYDGISTGMLKTKAMRDTIIMATILFFATYWIMFKTYNNNALWFAFLVFLIFRGISLAYLIAKDLKHNSQTKI